MYVSLNALLCSPNFHSPRKPNVPILNDNIGGTVGDDAKSDEARSIVPSPPSVLIKSTLSCSI